MSLSLANATGTPDKKFHMIPDARRIQATRRWAFGEASMLACFSAAIILAINTTAYGIAVSAVVAIGLAMAVYHSETGIIRRRMAIMQRPFPSEHDAILRQNIPYYASLNAEDRRRFQAMAAIFLDEKPIYGIGCAVDDTCRLLIAASAIIPVFSFPAWEYSSLRKILLRPEPFDADFSPVADRSTMASGMVGGTGLFDGIMILSKPELLAGFSGSAGKHNVGIHEFSHLIDQSDGVIDGIPATLPRECLRPWTTIVHEHLAHHAGSDSGIPAYGYTNEAEFFAVVSEYFFQSPDELATRDPELFALLGRIFRQDMLGRSRLMNHIR
jgi:Mlc titration factor MtfA (ptsG expression regulator)